MTAWLLAKYVPDLRRREPRNIGVIVIGDDGAVATRFIGETRSGVVDGRAVRFIGSGPVYREWINYWRKLAASKPDELIKLAASGASDENYFLEAGGQLVLGGNGVSPVDLLDDVYTALVDDAPDTSQESVASLAEQVISPLRSRLPKPILVESLIEVATGDAIDQLRFDYRYNNGVPNLMQRVSLTFSDQRSWDRVHAAAWTFEQVQRSNDPALAGARFIALYKPRDQDLDLDRQLGQLERLANTINVAEPEQATATLESMLAR
jgi:hypothetical protein